VAIQKVVTRAGEAQLQGLIQAHVDRTGSAKGKALLANWEASLTKFWQLVPPAERNTPEASQAVEAAPASSGVPVAA
jgi:glutamate synthase (ferredoxin)